MAEKSENRQMLEQYADALSAMELHLRMTDNRLTKLKTELESQNFGLFDSAKKELKNQLKEAQKEQSGTLALYRTYLARVNQTRKQVPECCDKKYFWDIPLEDAYPKPGDDEFSLGTEDYIELDVLSYEIRDDRYQIFQQDGRTTIVNLLNRYQELSDRVIPLYYPKKKLKQIFSQPVRRRIIYEVKVSQDSFSVTGMGGYNPAGEIWERYLQRRDYLLADLEERREEFGRKADMWERVVHNSLFTNEERTWMGQMSIEDYVHEGVFRDLHDTEMGAAVADRIAEERRQAEQAMFAATRAYMANRPKIQVDGLYHMNYQAVGEAVYSEGELVGLFLYCSEQPVYEVLSPRSLDPARSEQQIHSSRVLFRKKPKALSAIAYMAQAYGPYLPEYNPLKQKPANCSDGLFRSWMELLYLAKL